MKVSTPTLLPILRSDTQGRILATTLLAGGGMALSEIARRSETSLANVQREIERLSNAGIVTTERRGNLRLVYPTENEITEALARLVELTYGPVPMVRQSLDDIDGIEEAYIFGSYARRYEGEPGNVPQDIDVLIVTDDFEADDEAIERMEALGREIGRRIDVQRVAVSDWQREPTPRGLITTVKQSPIVKVKG